ncbi:phospholipase [Oceanihabitans sp. IOP_32]|uniref:patatin-like phospholipase family protein n=1 Tax=Oceanihabitans sp. IOP_32 TaxID=2529032 RepID=UPI001293B8A1|nr:patatin-like phospholipase family protein [Oceanihabitans sp. IOP_32]QFZ54659.1 phospholipase [Oceanihabitans sp. IOP_32]
MKNVSLVLSGGGARGLAHIGVIEALENQNYNIHAITGTSMGALIGGVYAAGNLKAFKEWIINLDKVDVFKLIDFTLIGNGFVKGDRVFNELKTFIPDINIEDLDIKYAATATDITNRQEIVFTEGNLLSAIRASVSIPSVFTPVKNNDAILVDGGVVNNIPINHAKRIAEDVLIAVNVNANVPIPKKNEPEVKEDFKYQNLLNSFNKSIHKLLPTDNKNSLGYFDIMNKSYEMMRDQLVKLYLEIDPPDVLIEISRNFCNIYDFYRAEDLIVLGYETTRNRIAKNNFNV